MNIKMLEEALVVRISDTKQISEQISLSKLVEAYIKFHKIDKPIKLDNIFEIYFSIGENSQLIDIEILK